MANYDDITEEQMMKFIFKKLMDDYSKKSIDEDLMPRLAKKETVEELPLGDIEAKIKKVEISPLEKSMDDKDDSEEYGSEESESEESMDDSDCEDSGEYIEGGLLERMGLKKKPK